MPYQIECLPDIVYAAVDGEDRLMDLYLPVTDQTVPAILLLHGNLTEGDRKLAPGLGSSFADAGFAVARIDYQLNGETLLVNAVEDVRAAIRWLRRSALDYRIDAGRIGLWGSSAGSHLAVITQTLPRDVYANAGELDVSDVVQAIVAAYGPSDLVGTDDYHPSEANKHSDRATNCRPKFKPETQAKQSEPASIGRSPRRNEVASPISYIGSAPLPPMLILHGLCDTAVPPRHSQLLFDALARHRQPAMLMLFEGLGHGFFGRDADELRTVQVRRTAGCEPTVEERRVIDTVGHFFTRCLKSGPAGRAA